MLLDGIDGDFVIVEAYHVGDRAHADDMLAPLRALGPVNDTIKDALAPWTAPRMCLNFAETRHPAASLWTDQEYRRLRQIKAAVDPGDLIRANHPVAPA